MSEENENGSSDYTTPPSPDPFEFGPGASLVLGEMGLEPRKGGILLVSCQVEQFTVEAKIKPADYEQARGYASFVPRNLWIHVPVFDPERLVDESGNVGILGAVYRYIAQELDMAVFDTASRRLDLRTKQADRQQEVRVRRIDAGREVRKPEPAGEVL